MRTIQQIERDLADARRDLCGNLPTHTRVATCERLYDELQSAKREQKYWTDSNNRLNCRHGIILYGTGCVKCERDME